MLTEEEKLKRLECFINRIKEEIEKKQREINRYKDSIKIGEYMIKEITKEGINAESKTQ
jgi:hypothetical protein